MPTTPQRPEIKIELPHQRVMTLGAQTVIMGVVNVTPDSFSDGGLFYDTEKAVEQGLAMEEGQAGILDIGGESTRPGAEPVSAEDEADRVIPVIRALSEKSKALLSIDTFKAKVAAKAISNGAHIINDITAGEGDPEMFSVAAETKAGLVLMHMQGTPRTMQKNPHYDDVVAEVKEYLLKRAQAAREAGVARERIIIDPGIGFGKTLEHNLLLLRHMEELCSLGYPLLLGASRKTFIGQLTGRPPEERLWGTVGVHVLGAAMGAAIVRVHDPAPLAEALCVTDAVMAVG